MSQPEWLAEFVLWTDPFQSAVIEDKPARACPPYASGGAWVEIETAFAGVFGYEECAATRNDDDPPPFEDDERFAWS